MPWSPHTAQDNTMTMSSSWANTYVKANQEYLLSGKPLLYSRYFGGSFSTTSATFVNVSTANVKATVTLSGTRMLGYFAFRQTGTFSSSGGTYSVVYRAMLDGLTADGDATYGIASVPFNQGTIQYLQIPFSFSGLSAGTHTVTLQWKLMNEVAGGVGYTAQIPSVTGTGGCPIDIVAWEF